jgi:dethiobiotin synthetase
MLLPPRGLFITGTDTGVGKTAVAVALVRTIRAAGRLAGTYKPAVSGCETVADGTRRWGDVEQLGQAWLECQAVECGGVPREVDDTLRDRIAPQRFAAPLAPSYAARVEGRVVDDRLLTNGAGEWAVGCDMLLVEGAGGLLSPVSDERDNADLAGEFRYPLVVVARAGLGTINHTRLTVEAARQRGLTVAAILLVETRRGAGIEFDDPSVAHNRTDLAGRFPEVVVAELPYRPNGDLRNEMASLKISWWDLSRRVAVG